MLIVFKTNKTYDSNFKIKLWDNIFTLAEKELHLPVSTIRATVLLETISASFEMDEILYSLKDHSLGMNAGRWDYIFSAIKRYRDVKNVTMIKKSIN